MKISENLFGKTKKNEDVLMYTIEDEEFKVEVLNYGCIIKSIYIPDKNGKVENILLNFDKIEDYENDLDGYIGCIVGRVAGRIKNGVLNIGTDKYNLIKNNGNNNLHGGPRGLHNKVWESQAKLEDDKAILIFKYTSPHMEGGFPGEIQFTIKYIIQNKSLTIDYEGIPDRETYLNLTNHMYFNLTGNNKESIENHQIIINALGYYEVDSEIIPTKFVEESDIFPKNKFIILKNSLKSHNEQMKIVGGGYDHAFLLDKSKEVCVSVSEEKSGRRIKMYTDQDVVVFYTGNHLNKIKNQTKYGGFCLEAQDYPDIYNLAPKKMKIYSHKNIYTQKTKYIFE